MSFATHIASVLPSYLILVWSRAGISEDSAAAVNNPSSFLQTSWPEENRYPKSQQVLALVHVWQQGEPVGK